MTSIPDAAQEPTPAPQFVLVSEPWHGWSYVELPVQDTTHKHA